MSLTFWQSRLRWPLVAFLSLDAGQIDAIEQHRQLRALEQQAMRANFGALAAGFRQGKCTFLEPFVPNGQTVIVPIEELDPIATFGAEDEQVSRKGILVQVLLNEAGQRVETFAPYRSASCTERRGREVPGSA